MCADLESLEQYLPPAPARILDCGGGPGRYAIELARRGYEVILFDLSVGNLELARKKAAEAGVRLAGFEQGNAVDLSSFPDSHFRGRLDHGSVLPFARSRRPEPGDPRGTAWLKPGGVIFASFISRYAGHRDVAKKTPEFLLYGDTVLRKS